jgi:hypothetical protein
MFKLLAFVLPLGLDSFAVAAAIGAAGAAGWRVKLRVSAIFVTFEAGMPLIGLARFSHELLDQCVRRQSQIGADRHRRLDPLQLVSCHLAADGRRQVTRFDYRHMDNLRLSNAVVNLRLSRQRWLSRRQRPDSA